jgi:hypothetical protein
MSTPLFPGANRINPPFRRLVDGCSGYLAALFVF